MNLISASISLEMYLHTSGIAVAVSLIKGAVLQQVLLEQFRPAYVKSTVAFAFTPTHSGGTTP